MSTNCLKSTLKSSVSNEELPRLGKARVFFNDVAEASFSIKLSFDENTEVKFYNCKNNGASSATIGTTPVTLNNFTFETGTPYIEFDKYKVKGIFSSYMIVSMDDFSFVNKLFSVGINRKPVGNITDVAAKIGGTQRYPADFELGNGTISGDVSGLGTGGFLKTVYFSGTNDVSKLYGTLNNLGYSGGSLQSINPYQIQCPATKNVSLDVIEFVKKARKYNSSSVRDIVINRSSDINMTIGSTAITFARTTISWTASTITYSDGNSNTVTINNSEVEP